MSTTDNTRLARFVADLALDPEKLQAYLAEPAEAMAAAGLTEEECGLLTNPGVQALMDYIWEVGPKPAPDEDTGGGGQA